MGVSCPGIFAPVDQSTCIASIAAKLTITVLSTGVPVFSNIPDTLNG